MHEAGLAQPDWTVGGAELGVDKGLSEAIGVGPHSTTREKGFWIDWGTVQIVPQNDR